MNGGRSQLQQHCTEIYSQQLFCYALNLTAGSVKLTISLLFMGRTGVIL
jgi:hypothetical protein